MTKRLFNNLRNKNTNNEVASQIFKRRANESLIEKFTRDFHNIDLNDNDKMYDYILWNIKDIFKTFNISKDLREGLFFKGFLKAIFDVVNQNKEFVFTPEEVVGFNDAAYLYLVTSANRDIDNNLREESIQKIFKISQLINPIEYENISIFSNIFSYNFLNEVFITRNSNKNETVNIKRLNFMVFSSLDPHIYEDLDIVGLYRNLFWDNIPNLFLTSFFDVYNEENNSWYTNNYAEMDGWITNAILYLLNELPISLIRKTLTEYSQVCLVKQSKSHDVRCSLRYLSEDYSKVKFISEEMVDQGLYII